jgi:hypothetical protein
MKPLNLLWRRHTLDRVPEAFFIERVLLAGLGRPVRVLAAETMAPFVDDLIVVSLTTEFAPYLVEARRRGMRNLMLLHLGDEHGTDDKSFYAHADLVLRNYWFEAIMTDPKVCWVPNGYSVGVGPAGKLLPTSARRSAGFFAGALGRRTLSGERHAMKAAIEGADLPFALRWTATARDRLGAVAYAAALGDARFAPVPGGNSPETIRLYDALEMGAIPIMLRSRFVEAQDALASPPILLLDDWAALPDAYRRIADDSPKGLARLDRWQVELSEWWAGFKRLQQQRLRARIDAVLGD